MKKLAVILFITASGIASANAVDNGSDTDALSGEWLLTEKNGNLKVCLSFSKTFYDPEYFERTWSGHDGSEGAWEGTYALSADQTQGEAVSDDNQVTITIDHWTSADQWIGTWVQKEGLEPATDIHAKYDVMLQRAGEQGCFAEFLPPPPPAPPAAPQGGHLGAFLPSPQ